ncbi:hypothetical protein AB0L44_39825 [Nonomuraea wenchangensis]|uniref:hypothetical protein n=1 Tax=Nonomuraea wenchangensis TaxID=568860 RepID=UPI0034138AC5
MGGSAEYAAVPTHSIAVLPDGLTTAQAAALPLAGITALRLLRTAGAVTDRRLLLIGASGEVGLALGSPPSPRSCTTRGTRPSSRSRTCSGCRARRCTGT